MAADAGASSNGSVPSSPGRQSLILVQNSPYRESRDGDNDFHESLSRLYVDAENEALEKLIALKARLVGTPPSDFWEVISSGLADIAQCQFVVVSKQLHMDEETGSAVPPLGEEGSCLTAIAWYYDDGHGNHGFTKDIKYAGFNCPCAHMRHGKVVLIPDHLMELHPGNPNAHNFPFPAEASLAVPLYVNGEMFSHCTLMFTKEGARNRQLNWAFLEMLLHSFADIFFEKLVVAQSRTPAAVRLDAAVGMAAQPVAVPTQNLRPLARRLSHELRTPLQGIIGMLDVMYASVNEAAGSQSTSGKAGAEFFQKLKNDIESMLVSSHRSIEVADNVVQAYALGLGLPSPDVRPTDGQPSSSEHESMVTTMMTATALPFQSPATTSPAKRPLSEMHPDERPSKIRALESAMPEPEPAPGNHRYDPGTSLNAGDPSRAATPEPPYLDDEDDEPDGGTPSAAGNMLRQSLNSTNLRELIKNVIGESFQVITIPTSLEVEETELGQLTHTSTDAGDGTSLKKTVSWTVDPAVPELIMVDERTLAKLISCVFHNSLKFTVQGTVDIRAAMEASEGAVTINVKDTGPGIDPSFQKNLFKPFAKGEATIKRQTEGLGLGLLVAKGLSKKLGGDLKLVWSSTVGPDHGTEFQIKIPALRVDPTEQKSSLESKLGHMLDAPLTPVTAATPLSQRPSVTMAPRSVPPGTSPESRDSATSSPGPLHLGEASVSRAKATEYALSRPPPKEATDTTLPDSVDEKDMAYKPYESTNTNAHVPNSEAAPPTTSTPRRPPPQGLSFNDPPKSVPSSRRKREPEIFDRSLATNHPLTFLVAEDNAINRRLLVNMLTKLGYDPKTQIWEAHDGFDAIKQVKRSLQRPHSDKAEAGYFPPNIADTLWGSGQYDSGPKTPKDTEKSGKGPIDVVLMDLWMPGCDGFEATEKILDMYRPSFHPSTSPGASLSSLATSKHDATLHPSDLSDMASPGARPGAWSAVLGDTDSKSSIDSSPPPLSPSITTSGESSPCWLVPPTILAVTADATDGAVEKAARVGMQGFMVKPFRMRDLEKLVKEGWSKRCSTIGAAILNINSIRGSPGTSQANTPAAAATVTAR